MPWFMTPYGPQHVIEPGTIEEFERRDYVALTDAEAADYFAGVAFPDPPSFATEAEVPGIMATVAADAGSAFSVAQRATYVPAVILAGTGIDPTGTADSTTAVRALLAAAADGAHIHVPAGAVIRLTGQIVLDGAQQTLSGPGELRFTAGITNTAAVRVTGTGCTLRDLTITNPNQLGSATGGQSYGIQIAAHDVTVTGSRVDSFQNGIVVAPEGEWLGTLIAYNRVTNVLGAGGGRGSASNLGEDRGDGIIVWGARARVIGNLVTAKPGTDARIGIHAEGLGTLEVTPSPYSGAMVSIVGNDVAGQFRRGIAAEEVSAVISGNTVADSTWWGIGVSGSDNADDSQRGTAVTGNTVLWTRTALDDQGSAWTPIRSPIMLYGGVEGCTVSGNTVRVLGVADAGIQAQGVSISRLPRNCAISGNTVATEGTGTVDAAIFSNVVTDHLRIDGNILAGFADYGVHAYGAEGVQITDNTIDGLTSPAGSVGIQSGGSASAVPTAISGNLVRQVVTGIAWYNHQYARINDNTVETVTTGVDVFGCSSSAVIGNVIAGATTDVSSAGGAGMVVVNNL